VVSQQGNIVTYQWLEEEMNRLESLLYPALAISAGIILGLFISTVEKHWTQLRYHQRQKKADRE
jgi:hypothetical protein